MSKPDYNKQDDARGQSLADYWPLMVLILVSAAAGFALSLEEEGWQNAAIMDWMHYFMGFFLCVFALLKLFHPSAFADGFRMYDMIAKRSRLYAYFYPLIELGLGLAYLSFLYPLVTYGVTIAVMTIGTIGVVSALRQGLDINCPCMGSVLDVPLSTVTFTEDIGMGLMAAVMFSMMIT